MAYKNNAKILKNHWNPGIWVPIWEYSAIAIQWIPTWQDLGIFQISLRSSALDKSSSSNGRVNRCKDTVPYNVLEQIYCCDLPSNLGYAITFVLFCVIGRSMAAMNSHNSHGRDGLCVLRVPGILFPQSTSPDTTYCILCHHRKITEQSRNSFGINPKKIHAAGGLFGQNKMRHRTIAWLIWYYNPKKNICCLWLDIWPTQNEAKKLNNYWNPGTWELTWEYSVRAIQWIPTWQGLDVFQKSLRSCALDRTE